MMVDLIRIRLLQCIGIDMVAYEENVWHVDHGVGWRGGIGRLRGDLGTGCRLRMSWHMNT